MGSVTDRFLKEYGSLTEIQGLAAPHVSGHSNCLVMAPTGSGKTEAVMLPLLDRILDEGRQGLAVIYVTPLRALNRDMFKRVEKLCRDSGISVAVRHGDTKQSERARQSRRAPQVLITTPETLQSILPTKSFSGALRNVMAVVVDEIHELYSSKRGALLSVGLERLERFSSGFQRIGIGATIGNPGLVSRFLCPYSECVVVSLAKAKDIRLSIELPSGTGERLGNAVEKFNLDGEAAARLGCIIGHIRGSRSTLVFANTRQVVEAIGSKLVYINGIEPFGGIGVHHGSLNKEERIMIEDSFKDGRIRSVIATSSLELGIDVGSVDLVVQYGSPRQSVRLLQRIGRSGHSASRGARGAVIATSVTDAMETLALYSNAMAGRLESPGTHDNALDVLVHQSCGMLLDFGPMDPDALYKAVRKAYVFRSLTRKGFDRTLEFMERQRLVRIGKQQIEAAPQARLFYYGHVSFIPDSKRFAVRDFNSNRIISGLDDRFVSSYLQEGSVFITKGVPWKVLSVDEDSVTVEPSSDFEAAIPDWSGEDIPVSRETASSVFGLFSSIEKGVMSRDLEEKVRTFVSEQNAFFTPGEGELVIEDAGEHKIVYSCLGSLANDALSKIVSYFLASKLGRSVTVRVSPYLILFESIGNIDLEEFIMRIDPEKVPLLLENAVARSDIFGYRFATVAKFLGIIERDATLSKSMVKRLVKVLRDSPAYDETVRELMHNYFDTGTLSDFMRKLRSGKVVIRRISARRICPFGDAILNSLYYTRELVMPVTPSSVVVDSFMDYSARKDARLVCTYCGFRFSRKLNAIMGRHVSCPDCGSVMITYDRDEYAKVIAKRISDRRLTQRERAIAKLMLAEASLFSSYGGRAAVALGTYGVGLKTAARVLMMLRRSERDFFCDLIEAQKQFIRTKKYWSV